MIEIILKKSQLDKLLIELLHLCILMVLGSLLKIAFACCLSLIHAAAYGNGVTQGAVMLTKHRLG